MTHASSTMTVLICLCMVAVADCSARADNWRVVVQDVNPRPLAIEEDLVAAKDWTAQQMFHIVNMHTNQTVFTRNMPSRVVAAAIAPEGNWCAVSTDQAVYRIELATGEATHIAPGAAGYLAISTEGTRLAVLGRIDPGEDGYSFPSQLLGATKLGVYDLKEKRWLHRVDTPIRIQHRVIFQDGAALAYGQGGRVSHRVASGFDCDVRLDLATGKTVVSRGPEKYGSGRMVNATQDHFAGYRVPNVIGKLNSLLESTHKTIVDSPNPLNPSGRLADIGKRYALLTKPDVVYAAIDRDARQALISINRDGNIGIKSFRIGYGGVYPVGGHLLTHHYGEATEPVIDVETGKQLFTIPRMRDAQRAGWTYWLPSGCLVYSDGQLSFYQPNKHEACWSRDFPGLSRHIGPVAGSPDSIYLAIGFGDNSPELAIIVSAETGKIVARIPRPDGNENRGHCHAAAFSESSDRLGLIFKKRLFVYKTMDAELLHEHQFDDDQYIWRLLPLRDSWLLGTSKDSVFYRELEGFGARIPMREALRARDIRAQKQRAVLIESRDGAIAIVAPEDGTTMAAWSTGRYFGNERGQTPRAVAAFAGKSLVCNLVTRSIELVDLETLAPVVTIHYLPVETALGWIAFTPDGFWTASNGADKFVAVFAGDRPATKSETQARRNPTIVRKRIRAATNQTRARSG